MTVKQSNMNEKQSLPNGEMVLRTLAMPADTNANGDIFGGWLMSQMDMGGAIQAKEIAKGRVVTVRVDGMTFLKPVAVGDVVCCYARCIRTGNSSITINVEVWVKKVSSEPIGQRYRATEAVFTYVAVDESGKSRQLPDGRSNFSVDSGGVSQD
ncbi:acyl-CoA thioester hydrolase YciA [Rahnella sp. LAC-M12]|nr:MULTISPECIES: acyl-CoA thioester hydrolase YciA [Rahnella]MBF7998014.1 acyl-CoA thioester hydrolase YciA [Rahnella sp. LAC-M12]MBU9819516.1 acyl-CoA thioester hydrolase YciA [Rahnella sp. BCC 1045]MDF1893786.1 acyl-CoA thioester hydrolase YciA [Rahnella contaminans]MBF7978269.1 acyl-CoA thioester hydrolase YciA [Rahnella laticis]MBF7995493.1 acyl-CoA thioester hydrolase YciA [Rahnella laticis]